MRGPSPSRLALAALAALVPWSWFLLRDVLGGAGDVIAILMPAIALLVVCALAVAGIRWRLAWLAAASTLLMTAVAVLSTWLPADTGPVAAGRAITVAAANVDGGTAAIDTVVGLSADVLVISEVSYDMDDVLTERYPHEYSERNSRPKVGVYSRLPLTSVTGSSDNLPGMRIELATPSGPVVLYALHVPRPWPAGSQTGAFQATVGEHRELIDDFARRAAAETVPTMVVGDLNAADRSSDYRVLLEDGQLVDAMRHGWVGPTSTTKWAPLLLRIDHLLVSEGWCGDAADSFDLPGSSHRGITATVGPCR